MKKLLKKDGFFNLIIIFERIQVKFLTYYKTILKSLKIIGRIKVLRLKTI